MDDNKRKLYNALSQDYDLGTYEQFESDIADAGKRRKLYDATIEEYDFGDFSTFEKQLGFGIEQKTTASVPAQGSKGGANGYTFTAEELGIEDEKPGVSDAFTADRGKIDGVRTYKKVSDQPATLRPSVAAKMGKDNAPNWGDIYTAAIDKAVKGEVSTEGINPDGAKPAEKENIILGIDMTAYNAAKAKLDEQEKKIAERMPQQRKTMVEYLQKESSVERAQDRALANVKADIVADDAEALTGGLLEDYMTEGKKRKDKVEKSVKSFSQAVNPYADPLNELIYENNTTKVYKADELGMIEEFAQDARNKMLTDEGLKAKAEENAAMLGISLEQYVDKIAVPVLQEKMYNEWVAPRAERAKKNYNGIMAATESSLFGMLYGATMTDTDKYLRELGAEEWGKNASILDKALAGAGSMILDLPAFMGVGSLAAQPAKAVGGQVFKQIAKSETKRLVAKGVAETAAQRYANYAVRNGLKNRILLNLSTAPLQSGLTFGMFDAGKTALNMSLNGEWDWGELGKSTAGGFLLGAALGGTNAVGGGVTAGLTGSVKTAAKIAEFGVENAVFTEGGRLIGKLHGEQPENSWWEDYLVSGATLLMLKAPNIVKNVSAIKGDKEASEVFAFNKLERELLTKNGEELAKVLEEMLPKGKKMTVEGEKVSLDGVNEGVLTEQYVAAMNNPEIPLVTKAKLMAVVEGKVMPAPRVTTVNIDGNAVKTYDPMGRLVETKEFKTAEEAKAEYMKATQAAEIEGISFLEDMYVRLKGYQADDVTVKEWLAKNPDVKAEDVARIVAKDNVGEPLTKAEQKILDSLREARREGLNDLAHLNEVLAGLEQKGINAKDVISGIEKPASERTEAENKAVNAYREVLMNEVEYIFKAKKLVTEAEMREQRIRTAEDVERAAESVRRPQEGVKMLADRMAESDARIDETANDGMVYTTTTPSGEKVIITGGKVVLDNEGFIDVNQSEGLVTLMPDGTKKSVRVDELREKVEVSNAEELKAAKREEIKQEVAAENGWKPIEVGAEHDVVIDGDVFRVKIEGRNENGDVIISNEGETGVVPESYLQHAIKEAEALQAENAKALQTENQIETPVVEGPKGENAEKVVEPVGEVAAPVVEAPKTALEQIPRNENNIPLYEQVDSELAWDGVVEEAGGNEETAMLAVNSMVADKKKALAAAEKAKAKAGVTITEKIAAENERVANIEKAKADLAKWEEIAGVKAKRALAAEAESKRIADEAAARQRAEEERLRAEREAAERAEREALNGVPDMVDDKPQDARARGYRRVNGHKVDRQEPVQGLMGKEIAVKFSDNSIPTGRVAVIEAEQLQPSHIQGQRNPLHFIDEAQPKERNDAASVLSARKIAENVRPEEITSSVTAYTGAPTVNTRGEAVQGNNRSAALRLMWENNPEQATKYKQYLMDHAAEFGLNAEEIAAMKSPVLVNMLDVSDADAITLGQYVAQDTESGGTERIKPKNVMQKMGGDMRSFANKLLASNNEEASFAELVDANGVEVLKWMAQKGYITPTQYKSAFDSKGNLTAEVKNDLRDVMYQSIFKGGSTQLEEMFNALPAKAQKAILATAFRDYDSPSAERMNGEVQNSIRAYYALARDAAFANAKNYKEAKEAAMMWARQYQLDDVSGESFLPLENFSNFAIELAVKFKGETQKTLQNLFNNIYDLIQGTKQASIFEEADNTPRTLKEAIKETFNIDYNGQYDSNSLAGGNKAGQPGRQGTAGSAATGERIEGGERPADSTGGTRGNGEVSSPEIPNSSTGETTIPVEANAEGGNAPGQSGVQQNESGTHPVADEVLAAANEKQQARFAEHAKAIAEKLGVEVTVHNDESTVTNRDAMKAIAEGGEVKGWYNPNTGEIALFLPAMESMRDVESTILHEAVSHYGIKHLLKEDWTKFLDGVWDMMPAGVRAHFLQYVGADMKNPSQEKMRQAADEYVAHIAEKMDLDKVEKSIWNKLIDAVFNALRKIGFKNLTRGDIETVIRASYKNMRQNGGNSQVTGQGETMASKKSGRNEGTMFRISKTPQEFDATQKEAVEKRGIVAPNLNSAVVNVVDVPKHDFTGSLKEARAQAEDWAVKNYTGREFDFPDNSGKYVISKKAIGKYLDKTAVEKSDNAAVHLSALKKLPEIISNSIEVELHADYKKDGQGRSGKEIDRDDLLIHRLYGAINIGGDTYRVKTTIREFKDVNTPNSPHSYEVTKIELIEDSTVTPDGIDSPLNRPINSISATKLLNGVEKSYDKGKFVLEESENSSAEEENRTRFRKANENQEIFVSNARKAVEEIKQEKATPEQWIAMLKKNGGLKAGEEAWLGLEEWLNEKQGAVTKQEILDFIGENKIQIEEVRYAEEQMLSPNSIVNLESTVKLALSRGESIEDGLNSWDDEFGDNMLEAYENGTIRIDEEGNVTTSENLAFPINEIREHYTTEGLDNKREIALTVPTIEPYNESDEIHFGDAGNGRAVAWVRFGETTDSEGNRVLVIDEIQSKRHQDGREKGYATEDYIYAKRERDYLYKKMYEKGLTEEEHERYKWLQQYTADNFGVVPSAPFEKNWHELAMKRMLRLAAEEGFDKVAWTTGEQQAQRYNLGAVLKGLKAYKTSANEYYVIPYNNGVIGEFVKEYTEQELADTFGKELAQKIITNAENATEENPYEIEGEELRVGGEGMKGFYDRMLPSFVSKYTKKWGAKVGEVTMPNLRENNTMHSVDVTPEMKESVMEGQTMFRRVVDRDGNPIGDGSWHMNYKVDEVALSYPYISYKVDESASTESVYVTYTNNDPKYPENERPKVTVRYSNHESNAVKFGDQLRGHMFDESTPVGKRMAERQTNILLTRLGLKKAVPVYGKYIPNRMVSNREIEQGIYEETDKTIQEMYDLPIGTDISQYKGKVAKGSRYLIEGDEVERGQIKDYKFVDVSKKEPVEEYVVENNANFVSTYKTKDGKDIEYTSERAEGYGIQGGGTGNYYDGTGNSILQRQTDTGVPGANSGLNADKGEFCVVERVFTENGAFNFTSGEKIESADDVAYIFSALEDAAKEHSFVVYVKDGKPTVIELGMGSFNATMVDIPTASLAYSRINPDHVYFVHNHPSGNLVCSDPDVAMLRMFEDMSDVPVTGVIINLKTGKYGTFDTERHSVIGEKRVPENEERLTVHTLDKQIFAPDYDPMAQPLVRSSQDVAQFLNSQRMGDRPKVSFLILSRANRIIGNIHTPFTDISTDTEAVARYINERVIQFGGENAILYGDFAISMDESRGFRLLQGAMGRFGKTKLLDVVHVEGNFTKSAIDLGLLYEPETEYNVAKENEEIYNSPEQDIPVESVQTQPMTFKERIINATLTTSAKNKENLALRSDALRMFGQDVANVLKLMGKQREYDKSTVDQLVKLAKMYFKDAQLLGGLTPYQVGRVMTRLNNAVGKRDITDDANELVNILVDAHNKELEKILKKQAETKAKKVNASGVEVIGKLDKEGQLLLEEYNTGKELDIERIDEKIIDLQNEAADASGNVEGESGEPDAERTREVAARLRGLELARQYREEILKKRDEIKGLEQELKSAEQDAKDGAMDRAAYKEFRRATERAILESKLEMVDAYHGLIHGLGGDISSSAKRAKLFQQQQIDHVKEIQHNANSDLLGHPAEAQGETPDKWNSSVPRLFMSAMPTFQTMLKFFGEKAADGRGYLYERFIPQHTQASHNEYIGKTEAREKMREKLTEIFGKKTSIEDFMDMSRKDGAVLEYQEGGEKKTIDLTRGQVLYLYMINKMADGQMKLSRMGITDADVQKMAKELPEEMVRFADWVQEEFLTELREKYNKVHERMFGAPMAAIESYFPIKINKRSRGEKIEPGMNVEDKPSTVTGSVIKRTKNAVAIDLSADAMQVLLGHIDDMENWAAWAEFRRDVKSLLNYRHFQNQVKGMESLRFGSGEKLWKNFVDVANIAAGSFKPSSTAADRAVRNIAKGVVSSKIAFRYFTAVKQILSTPAFWSEVDFGKMMNAYLHQKEAWDWAMKNLPGFSKRWEGRASGNEILLESDADWKVWQNRAVQWLSNEGMRANAFIDALTVATGAKAVFETKYEMFKKAGYSEERAKEKALNRAAEAYNESQQSSESAYLSPLQAEATFVSSVLTAYRNSPFGYNRKMATAIANLKKKMKKGFKQESIEYMTKQLMRDGLNEEQAKEYAKSTYRRSVARDAADVALYGFFLNYIWVLGPSLIYILGGDDDEKKKDLNVEALIDGAMGGLGNLPAGETLTGAIKAIAEGDVSNFKLPQAVAMQDMETIADLMQTDPVRAAGEVLNILVAMGVGVNPQTFTDMFVALGDTEDWSDPREIAMLVLRLINAPNSKLELLEADEAMENYGANMEEVMKEYAEYQKSKRAPLSGWMYSDESEQKAIERYEKRFKKILDERLEAVVENAAEYDAWYENSNPLMRAKLSKLRKAYLEGDKKATFEKLEAEELVKKTLYGAGYDDTNTVYYELSNAQDEDMELMIDEKLNELKPAFDSYKKEYETLGAEEQEALYKKNEKMIGLYGNLKKMDTAVAKLKTMMKKEPEKADEYMNTIRELRTKAIDLINNYNE